MACFGVVGQLVGRHLLMSLRQSWSASYGFARRLQTQVEARGLSPVPQAALQRFFRVLWL
jgi:hypothetical protein